MALITRSELEFDEHRSRHRTSEQLSSMVLTIRGEELEASGGSTADVNSRLAYLSGARF
jgi:hypothetical protein